MTDGAESTDKPDEPFFTVAETAEHFQLSERQIWREIAAGKLVVHRFRRTVRISPQDRESYAARHRKP